MITSTALGTIMDAMASDAKSTSVITVMTAYSVSTDLGAAIGPTLIYWVVGSQYGVTSMYLARRCIRFDRVMVLEGICDKGAGISWRKS